MSREADTLHVVTARIDAIALPTRSDDWLHASERERLAALKAPSRRRQYLAGHWLGRELLARTRGGDASEWALEERRNRPPAVRAPSLHVAATQPPIQLGLAHSGDWIAAAVSRQPFGIDLEQRGRTLPRDTFLPLLLNPGEPDDPIDDEALLARWVAKEAWIKREQASAMPEQLRALRLHPDPDGPLHSFETDAFHLAIAMPKLTLSASSELQLASRRWRVELGPDRGRDRSTSVCPKTPVATSRLVR